ncbi:MAG: phage Gp37/Gp68 family protein [Candidatus Parabeggiatoa sp.]|nr:phage Gp37/Gp68 family protein [Candidatus Parabeggiatoa sp.]
MTKIEWTEETWNPITGCTKISPGCKHCYAETMAHRLQAMGTKGYENGFNLTLVPERLEQPLKRKKATTYFVNSMSDLFHEDVPFEFVQRVFDVMDNSSHRFQVLTKRPERMVEFLKRYQDEQSNPWYLSNVWFGVSVEDIKYGLPRIEYLRSNALPMYPSVCFLSIEPLLEDLGPIDLRGIGWVIVGGESGPKARPMKKEWVESIQKQCQRAGVKFFFKQWGTWGADGVRRSKKSNGCLLNGKEFKEIP